MSNNSGQAGIYAGSIGGDGGEQDSQAVGDQVGGRGGNGGAINVTNSADINFGIGGEISGFSYGIGAESLGGDGGRNTGAGGHGGTVQVTTDGTINQAANLSHEDSSSADTPSITDGVRAVSAVSRGGDGYLSEDGSDDGGLGGSGGMIATNLGCDHATVISTEFGDAVDDGSLQPISGAVVSISQGGDGGRGPDTATDL
ncbi:MAG: hypothetical protein ACI92Z_000390 [Paracoccaceae bacterium]|jgi:hypothetical protein